MLCIVVLTFESVEEILERGHSNENCLVILSCRPVYCAVQGGFILKFGGEICKCGHRNESLWSSTEYQIRNQLYMVNNWAMASNGMCLVYCLFLFCL